MERFDILNAQGLPIGQTAVKGTVLRDGQYYMGVHVYIYDCNDRFIIQQRTLNKAFLLGGWDICMGHMVAGETSLQCMIREVREEIALTISSQDVQAVRRVMFDAQYHHMVDVFFVCTEFDMKRLVLQKEEVMDVKTATLAEMTDMVRCMDYRPAAYRKTVLTELSHIRSIPQKTPIQQI